MFLSIKMLKSIKRKKKKKKNTGAKMSVLGYFAFPCSNIMRNLIKDKKLFKKTFNLFVYLRLIFIDIGCL